MKTIRTYVALFVLGLAFMMPNALWAQDQPAADLYILETVDGNKFTGKLISETQSEVVLETRQFGTLTFKKKDIESMKPLHKGATDKNRQQFWFESPLMTRYFFSNNALGLRKGTGYYQNTWVMFNRIDYGVTDNFTIGAGMIPTFLFTLGSGDGVTPIWLSSKLSIPVSKDNFHLAGGGTIFFLPGSGADIGFAGMFSGIGTIGDYNENFSIRLGWGYSEDAIASSPTIAISYMVRKKERWAFITENYFISFDEDIKMLLLSGGARYLSPKITVDMGGFFPLVLDSGQDVFPILPWLSIGVPLGRKR
ncbi:MAG: hypothetical protein D6714_05195 [Bacteroidetes bacterium]|nr:MAG: hypothetical protein D6714_05195 [Bacteroidota bacterium]